ncbi:MAG: AMP-binding protein, partial [Candidatus Dormibacterales bacterium]
MPLDGVVPFPPDLAARYRERGYWEGRLLGDVFWELFRRHAARTAFTHGGGRVTFQELRERAEGFARRLVADHGVHALDRVVVHLPNSPEFLYVYFALQRIRAIPLLALAPHRRLELEHFVRLAEARALVTTDGELGAVVRRDCPTLGAAISPGELAGAAPDFSPEPVEPTDPCVLLLSGGTTGIPKLIPRTHNDYLYNSRASAAVQDIEPGSVQLAVAPLAHNMPLACPGVQGFFLAGARVALAPGHDAEQVFSTIQRERVTHVAAVPALYIRWIGDASAKRYDLRSVRLLQSGGQRLQPEVRRRMAEVFPNAFVQENFGMSEGLLTFVRRDDPPEVRMETVG